MTFEKDEADSTLRALARIQLALVTSTIQQLCVDLDLPERIELTNWLNEGRRLLRAGNAPLPAPCDLPKNVRPLRRDLGARVRPARSYSQDAGGPLTPDDPPKGTA